MSLPSLRTVRAVLPHTALQSLVSSSGVSRLLEGCATGEQPSSREGAFAICLLDAVTGADTMRSAQIEPSAHPHSRNRRASAACLALSGTNETLIGTIQDLSHPASYPPSLAAVLLPVASAARGGRGNMRALTPAGLTLAGRSLRLRRLAVPAFRPQPRDLPVGRFTSRLSANGRFRASPRMSRLATASRRIRFVLLRTAGSPPVAPHPASRRRSFLRLRSHDALRHGLSPCRQSVLTDALTPAQAGVQATRRWRRGPGLPLSRQ